MDRRVAVDPHAPTMAEPPSSGERSLRAPASPHASIDPRADTLPSDGAASTPGQADGRLDPLIGRMLGHFRVEAPIGHGGMGAVYRASDTSLLRPVALKVLLADSATARTRLLREARAQAQLRHPNVVPIHYVGEAEGIVFFVMDLIDGESLTDLIRREGRIGPERALDIVDAVASALAAGHQAGLIHRDVKPSNILLEKSGRALLADFGLAKDIATADAPPPEADPAAPVSLRHVALTRAGAIVGTPAYLAPEQAAGAPVDHRADMYALGASLFEALTGAPPFDAPTPTGIAEQQQAQPNRSPRALVPDMHPSVEQLVVRLLQKRPEDRFATYEDLRCAVALARAPSLLPAPFVPRAFAFVIDYVLFTAFGGLLFGMLNVMGAGISIVAWAIAVLFAAVVEWRLGGASLGKRLMHLRTADRFGLAPAVGPMIGRTFFKALGPAIVWFLDDTLPDPIETPLSIMTLIAWLVTFSLALGKNRLALHDRLAGTRVVFGSSPVAPEGKRDASR